MNQVLDKIKNRYKINKESFLLLLSAIILISFTLFLVNLVSNISSFWSFEDVDVLPDTFFELIDQRSYSFYVDIMMNTFVTTTLICVLLRRDAIKIYLRLFTCLTVCYYIRISVIMITNLPAPRNCRKIVNNFLTTFTYNRCGDLMFSGHTLMVSTCVFTWITFDLLVNKTLSIIGAIISSIVGILIFIGILVARNHYTVDVLIGLYISSGVWVIYGFMWKNYFCKEKCFKSIIME